MFKKTCTILFLLILALAGLAPAANAIIGKVIGVADGDTITVLENRTQYKIRLYGIDAPEGHQDFGNRAKQFTADLVFGKIVQVEKMDTDRYGRTVGIVTVGKVCVNEELIKNGFAWVYPRYCNISICGDWYALEAHARASKKGLWAHADPLPPWEFRRNKRANR